MSSERRDLKLIEKALAAGRLSTKQYLEGMETLARLEAQGVSKTIAQVLEEKGAIWRQDLEALDDRSLEGETLAGFKIEKKLGEGGMGAVFRATQLSLGRPVALKILAPRYASDPEFVARFLREARAAARLDHPHVVQPLEIGEAKGLHFIAMEFCEGGSVASRIDERGRFTEREALEVVRAVGLALDYAAELGMVHRDIKPDNILFERTGTVKLADLGLAKDRSDGSDLTATGVIMGTPSYMSPEQALGQDDLDIRSDIYSLGIALYEMLTGKVPFKGSSPVVVLNRQVNEPLPDPRALVPGLSDEVCGLLARMTAKSREERFATPRDLVAAVDAIIEKRRSAPDERTMPPFVASPIEKTVRPGDPARVASPSDPTIPMTPRAAPRAAIPPTRSNRILDAAAAAGAACGASHDREPAAAASGRGQRWRVVLFAGLTVLATVLVTRPEARRRIAAVFGGNATAAPVSPAPAPGSFGAIPPPAPDPVRLGPEALGPAKLEGGAPPAPGAAPLPVREAETPETPRARVEPCLGEIFRAELTPLPPDGYRFVYNFAGPRAAEAMRDFRGVQAWRRSERGLSRPDELAMPVRPGRRLAGALARPPLSFSNPFSKLRSVEWTVEASGAAVILLAIGPLRFALLPRENRAFGWRGTGEPADPDARRNAQHTRFEPPEGALDVRSAAISPLERGLLGLRLALEPGEGGAAGGAVSFSIAGERVLALPFERAPAPGDLIEFGAPKAVFLRAFLLEGEPDWAGLDARR